MNIFLVIYHRVCEYKLTLPDEHQLHYLFKSFDVSMQTMFLSGI